MTLHVRMKSQLGNKHLASIPISEDDAPEVQAAIEALDKTDAEPNDGQLDIKGTLKYGWIKISAIFEFALEE